MHEQYKENSADFLGGPAGACGYDIALCTVTFEKHKLLDESIGGLHPYNGADVKDAELICDVSGYAADKGVGNVIYGQTGKAA